jgi:predicted hydrocarbon binding protein
MPAFTLDPRSLHRLHDMLRESDGLALPEVLHEAGLASGELLAERWRGRLGGPGGLQEAEQLDARWFGSILDEVCQALGWGSLTVLPIGDEAVLMESPDWAEATDGSAEQPGCRFTAGALSAFLTGQAEAPLSVLEVECRSTGADRCRFLAGSPEMMTLAGDLMSAGHDWREAFSTTARD